MALGGGSGRAQGDIGGGLAETLVDVGEGLASQHDGIGSGSENSFGDWSTFGLGQDLTALHSEAAANVRDAVVTVQLLAETPLSVAAVAGARICSRSYFGFEGGGDEGGRPLGARGGPHFPPCPAGPAPAPPSPVSSYNGSKFCF